MITYISQKSSLRIAKGKLYHYNECFFMGQPLFFCFSTVCLGIHFNINHYMIEFWLVVPLIYKLCMLKSTEGLYILSFFVYFISIGNWHSTNCEMSEVRANTVVLYMQYIWKDTMKESIHWILLRLLSPTVAHCKLAYDMRWTKQGLFLLLCILFFGQEMLT